MCREWRGVADLVRCGIAEGVRNAPIFSFCDPAMHRICDVLLFAIDLIGLIVTRSNLSWLNIRPEFNSKIFLMSQ